MFPQPGMSKTTAIILSAGTSQRMGFNKLLTPLRGKPVLFHAIAAFQSCDDISEIIVVASRDLYDEVADWGFSKLAPHTPGGAERCLSVWNGIQAASPDAEFLAFHDGARPLVTPVQISATIEAAKDHGAAALAHPVAETVKRADPNLRVTGDVDRDHLWAMETPQTFRRDLISTAYEKVIADGINVTDEVSAARHAGHEVQLVASTAPNPKITYPADLVLAEALLRQPEIKEF